jgi:hypothetical protein
MIRMAILGSLYGFAILTCFDHVWDFAHERQIFRKIAQIHLSFVQWL